jgi:hypothetical protein
MERRHHMGLRLTALLALAFAVMVFGAYLGHAVTQMLAPLLRALG